MDALTKGDKVRHDDYGIGEVVSMGNDGHGMIQFTGWPHLHSFDADDDQYEKIDKP